MLVNTVVRRSGGMDGELRPGDTVLNSHVIASVTTVGAGNWSGANIVGGIIRRSGPIAAYADTTDTSDQILRAARGNAPAGIGIAGLSMELYVANTVAFANTLTLGRGNLLGAGTVLNLVASSSKDYLLTIKNDTPEFTAGVVCNNTTTVLFQLPPGMTALKIGPGPDAINVTPGMLITVVSGTAPAAGTTVLGIRLGQGGILGVTCSAAINANVPSIIFSPVIEWNNVGLD